MALIQCPECGKEISDRASNCPNCGCPIHVEVKEERTQQVELTNVSQGMSKKFKKIGVWAVIIIVALVAAFFILKKTKEAQQKAEYEAQVSEYGDNLKTVCTKMLSGASDAEYYGGLLHDVWSNTIYEKDSYLTDKYTKDSSGEFNDDFNTSIFALQTDDSYSTGIDDIKENQTEVQELMKSLKNPPDDYKEAYNAVQEYYDSYLELTNLAVNPTGNLSSYTSSFNEADQNVANSYKKIQMYLD